MRLSSTVVAVLCVAAGGVAAGDVRPQAIFADHMVLQRGREVVIRGRAEPGEEVTVEFARETARVKADAAGRWLATLPALEASGDPRDMVIRGTNTVTIRDVLVGDVWLCSGQSNMSISAGHFAREPDVKADIAAAAMPLVRQFGVADVAAPEPQDDVTGQWLVCSPQTAGRFTAVGFAFARAVHDGTGVPIGILRSAKGSTRIDVWLPRGERHNAMIAPLAGIPIRGVLWYQGESNAGDAAASQRYVEQMRELVLDWRRLFGDEKLPFYFVQLPAYQKPTDDPAGGDAWSRMREAQARALGIPHTGMAVTIDIGEADDIHPRNKADVGKRLARLALRDVYGKPDPGAGGPAFRELKVEGGRARLLFDGVGSGLMVGRKEGRAPAVEDQAAPLRRFAVAGADRKWHWAEATIEGDTVVVRSPEVPAPVAVRYAYATNPAGANLYNRDGIPAAPFRTDDW